MTPLLRRLAGWAALLAISSGFATPLVAAHVGLDPDLLRNGSEIVAGHRPDEVADEETAANPEHCALCHWLLAMRGANLGALPHAAAVAQPMPAVTAESPDQIVAAGLPPGPSRAPPAS